jgi:DNA-binding MarR family transcriptional regulator
MKSVRRRSARASRGAAPVVRDLSRAFAQLIRRRIAWYRRVAAEMGLSAIQASTLFHMDPERASTMSAVAEAVGCGPSNLTAVVDKLEARGLVRRRAAPDDRRSKIVSMTADGAALRDRFVAGLSEPAPWMLALPASEQRQLRDLLRKALALEEAGLL